MYGVLRDEVAQDHQHAVIGLAQLVDLRRAVLVQGAHRVAGDDQHAAPDDDVEPAGRGDREATAGGRQEDGVVPRHQAHEQHAAERRQRRVPAAVEVGRAQRRQRVEAQDHPLAVDDEVQEQADAEEGQEQPQLLVHFLEAAKLGFHRVPDRRLDEGAAEGKNSAGARRAYDN